MSTEIKVQVRLQNGQHLSHANINRIVARAGGRRYRMHYASPADVRSKSHGIRTDIAGYYFWEEAPGGCGMCGTHATIRALVVAALTSCRSRIMIEDVASCPRAA